MILYLRKYGGE